MDKNSEAYKDGTYKDLFDAAESVKMTAEDVVVYSQSLAQLREYQSGLDYRYEAGLKAGRTEGRAEGRSEGRDLEREKNIEAARMAGLSEDLISKIFG